MDTQKRRKKIERRKAKEKAARKALAQRGSRDLAARIERSVAAPVLHCCTTEILWDQGMSNLLVSRELTSGNVAFVTFLVDVYCLGIKNVAYDVVSRVRYDREIYGKLFRDYEIVHLEPPTARKLVEDAVAYASSLGLSPHRDYRKAKLIFGDIDADLCTEQFEFGKDGEPFFIAGPHDSPSRCEQIMRILTDHCGPDGYHFLMPIGGSGAPLDESQFLRIDDE